MKLYTLFFILMIGVFSCNNNDSKVNQVIEKPDFPVTDDDSYITQEYVDSLKLNRQQKLVTLRAELGFNCVNLLNNGHVNLKIKVYPDGKYDDVEILKMEGLDIVPIRDCVDNYFEENKLNLGALKDLPSSGKTTNKHPHVYTLMLY